MPPPDLRFAPCLVQPSHAESCVQPSSLSAPLDETLPIPGVYAIALPCDDWHGGTSHAVLENRPCWLGNLAHPHVRAGVTLVYRNAQSFGPAWQSLLAGQCSSNRAPNQIPNAARPARVAVYHGMYRGWQIRSVKFARVIGQRPTANIADVQFSQPSFWPDPAGDQRYSDFQHAGGSCMHLTEATTRTVTSV
jgi:hypothetical protein